MSKDDSRDPLGKFLESRDFYELCQKYRWSVSGASEFEALKYSIKTAAAGEFCYWYEEENAHDRAVK